MIQEKTAEIRDKMKHALLLLMEAADLSIAIVKDEDGRGGPMKALWEDFIREFLRYTKNKSRETGIDLVSLVSITRILR